MEGQVVITVKDWLVPVEKTRYSMEAGACHPRLSGFSLIS